MCDGYVEPYLSPDNWNELVYSGKVDLSPNGGKVDLSPNGGKVDSSPNGGKEDSSPNGGKEDSSPNGGKVEDSSQLSQFSNEMRSRLSAFQNMSAVSPVIHKVTQTKIGKGSIRSNPSDVFIESHCQTCMFDLFRETWDKKINYLRSWGCEPSCQEGYKRNFVSLHHDFSSQLSFEFSIYKNEDIKSHGIHSAKPRLSGILMFNLLGPLKGKDPEELPIAWYNFINNDLDHESILKKLRDMYTIHT